MEVGGQRHAPAALPPGKRPGTYCTYGWVSPRAGLGRCGKSCSHRESIPGPSSPQRIAIPTELSRPARWTPSCTIICTHTQFRLAPVLPKRNYWVSRGVTTSENIHNRRRIPRYKRYLYQNDTTWNTNYRDICESQFLMLCVTAIDTHSKVRYRKTCPHT
jgi:hypothetical protein